MDNPCHHCITHLAAAWCWTRNRRTWLLSCDGTMMPLGCMSMMWARSPLQKTLDTEDSGFVALNNIRLSMWVLQEEVVFLNYCIELKIQLRKWRSPYIILILFYIMKTFTMIMSGFPPLVWSTLQSAIPYNSNNVEMHPSREQLQRIRAK